LLLRFPNTGMELDSRIEWALKFADSVGATLHPGFSFNGSAGKGVFATAAEPVTRGTVLVQLPLAATSEALGEGSGVAAALANGELTTRLVLRLLEALAQPASVPEFLQSYLETMPRQYFEYMPVCWPKPALEELCHCAVGLRVLEEKKRTAMELRVLRDADFFTSVGAQWTAEEEEANFQWCKLMVQTRAFHLTSIDRKLLLPLLDLINAGPKANCAVRFNQELQAVEIHALTDLPQGQEITITYKLEADVLDHFEEYGFLDQRMPIQTAELVIPVDHLPDTLKVLGSSLPVLETAAGPVAVFWVGCGMTGPLEQALEAAAEHEADQQAAAMSAYAHLRSLIEMHLTSQSVATNGGPTSSSPPPPNSPLAVARRVRAYEKRVLQGKLREISLVFRTFASGGHPPTAHNAQVAAA